MSTDTRTIALCAGVTVLWGVWGVLAKLALRSGVSPRGLFLFEAAASCALAAVLALPTVAVGLGRTHRAWFFGALAGAALASGLLTFYFALERDRAAVVVVCTSTYPLVTLLLSWLLLDEPITTAQLAGAALILVGLALLLS